MKVVKLPITTDTSGAGTYTGNVVAGGGLVMAIEYHPGSIANGATVTVTDEYAGASFTIWSKATAGTSNIRRFPRVIQTLNTDGSDLTTHTPPIITGKPKVTVSAAGGATTGGYVLLHILEA